MIVVYVAKHASGDNDDEGAISHALVKLGHHVVRLPETATADEAAGYAPDLVLFHKWADLTAIGRLSEQFPTACWYFDRVFEADAKAARSCAARVNYVRAVGERVTNLFLTDGDWADRMLQDGHDHVSVLRQGADERVAAFYGGRASGPPLFVGNNTWSNGRRRFVHELVGMLGGSLRWEQDHHRSGLGRLISGCSAVIAPDSPGSHRYWSNRIYLVLGFGGLLLHPPWQGLAEEYTAGVHYEPYTDRREIPQVLDRLAANPDRADAIREAALEHTLAGHTYTLRVKHLLEIVCGPKTD